MIRHPTGDQVVLHWPFQITVIKTHVKLLKLNFFLALCYMCMYTHTPTCSIKQIFMFVMECGEYLIDNFHDTRWMRLPFFSVVLTLAIQMVSTLTTGHFVNRRSRFLYKRQKLREEPLWWCHDRPQTAGDQKHISHCSLSFTFCSTVEST